MFRDDFKNRYTTIPFAIYRAYYEHERIAAISHQHKEIELISVKTGSADFYVDTQCYKIKKGDVLLIPPYLVCTSLCFPVRNNIIKVYRLWVLLSV